MAQGMTTDLFVYVGLSGRFLHLPSGQVFIMLAIFIGRGRRRIGPAGHILRQGEDRSVLGGHDNPSRLCALFRFRLRIDSFLIEALSFKGKLRRTQEEYCCGMGTSVTYGLSSNSWATAWSNSLEWGRP
jgi:hypothetical protein